MGASVVLPSRNVRIRILEVLTNQLAEARSALAEARRVIDARNLQIDARDVQLREQESELAMVRREMETNAALLTKLQRELDGSEGPSREMAIAREPEPRATDPRTTFERAANSQTAQATQAVEAAASEQAAAAVSQGGPEVAKLMARARELLDQGNSARRGECSSALPRRAALWQASPSRRPMTPSFSPNGGHMERAAMRRRRGTLCEGSCRRNSRGEGSI